MKNFFYLQASRSYRLLVFGLHLFVFLLVLFSTTVLLIKVVAVLICGISYYLADKKRKSMDDIESLGFDKGKVIVSSEAFERYADINGAILSTPFLIMFPVIYSLKESVADELKTELKAGLNAGFKNNAKKEVVLFRDALPKDQWRQLRVLLRTLPANTKEQKL